MDVEVLPIATVDYPTAATRPAFTILDKTKVRAAYGIDIPHWRKSLRRCMKLITN